MNLDKAKQFLDFFVNEAHKDEFYPTLLLFERLGVRVNELNDKVLNEAYKLTDNCESIYNEDLRSDIDNLKNLLSKNKNKEQER